MDLILGRFADRNLPAMDREQLDSYALLLEESDPDIYDWLTGQKTPPADDRSRPLAPPGG